MRIILLSLLWPGLGLPSPESRFFQTTTTMAFAVIKLMFPTGGRTLPNLFFQDCPI